MSPRRLLIAEDNVTLTMALAAYLRRTGHTVDIADDGLGALEFLRRSSYDLIVLDYNLPRVHGVDVLRFVRQHLGDVPVLLFSALHDAERRLESEGICADVFLPKPFGLREFDAAIERLLPSAPTKVEGAEFGPLRRDEAGDIRLDGVVLNLADDERTVAQLLIEAGDLPVSPEQLQHALEARGLAASRDQVRDCVTRLQARLGERAVRIAWVRGLGCCLVRG